MADGLQIADAEAVAYALNIVSKALQTVPAVGLIDSFEDSTDWTPNVAASISDNTAHIAGGSKSIQIDKVAGDAVALIERTFTDDRNELTENSQKDLNDMALLGIIRLHVFVPTGGVIAGFVGVKLRLGTDSSNYLELSPSATAVTENEWNEFEFALAVADTQVGDGLNYRRVSYIAVGLEFSDAGDTDTDFLVDSMYVLPQQTVEIASLTAAANSLSESIATVPAAALIEGFEDSSEWTANASATIGDSTTHVAGGTQSVSVDKISGGIDTALIEKTLSAADKIDIDNLAVLGLLRIHVFVPAGAGAANFIQVTLRLGTDSTDNFEWNILLASLTEGEQNEIDFDLAIPDLQNGSGLDYTNLVYFAVELEFTNDTDVLPGFLVDSMYVIPQQTTI